MTYCPIPKDSIVGADQFHGSVRNGKMWFLIAQITETSVIITLHAQLRKRENTKFVKITRYEDTKNAPKIKYPATCYARF